MTNEDNLNKKWRSNTLNPLRREAVEKILETTGDLARIDAQIAGTYIVYIDDGKWLKEFPNGEIVEINMEIDNHFLIIQTKKKNVVY